MLDFFLTSITIGVIVFLIQKTDFIKEYLCLFLDFLKQENVKNKLLIKSYENSSIGENYISFLGSTIGCKNNFAGFVARLLACFICLCVFLNFAYFTCTSIDFIKIMPSSLVSATIYYLLYKIQKEIYNN